MMNVWFACYHSPADFRIIRAILWPQSISHEDRSHRSEHTFTTPSMTFQRKTVNSTFEFLCELWQCNVTLKIKEYIYLKTSIEEDLSRVLRLQSVDLCHMLVVLHRWSVFLSFYTETFLKYGYGNFSFAVWGREKALMSNFPVNFFSISRELKLPLSITPPICLPC